MRPIAGFDLDSTLYDTGHRHRLIHEAKEAGRPIDWHAYSMACGEDTVVEAVAIVARALSQTHDIAIISGRNVEAEALTRNRLILDEVGHMGLWLDDGRHGALSHAEYKLERVRDVERETGQKVAVFFEDWADVALLLNQNGYPTICVRTPQEIVEMAGVQVTAP
jgi:phosphoserine phosphatase